jgi:hypothetical protein
LNSISFSPKPHRPVTPQPKRASLPAQLPSEEIYHQPDGTSVNVVASGCVAAKIFAYLIDIVRWLPTPSSQRHRGMATASVVSNGDGY